MEVFNSWGPGVSQVNQFHCFSVRYESTIYVFDVFVYLHLLHPSCMGTDAEGLMQCADLQKDILLPTWTSTHNLHFHL